MMITTMTMYTLLLFIAYTGLPVVISANIVYHINEEESPHTYIGDIAIDSNLSYSLTLQQHTVVTFTQLQRKVSSGSHLFNVTNSGKLYTTQTLDAESLCIYKKECFKIVKVAVRKAETFTKILKIKIIIEDINDHQPQFPENEMKLEFYETDVKGISKSIPNAVDKDIGLLNSKITYKLKDKSKKFSLSIFKGFNGINLLKITLEGMLDRESKDTYMLQLVAKDGGSPPKEGLLNIEISVIDVNDNQPQFPQQIYNISISDTHHISTPVFILSATDLDSDKNGDITYNFYQKASSYAERNFKLMSNGEIFLNENFYKDREQIYKLYIQARDRGRPPLSSTAMLIINVINNQNNAPNINIDFVSPLTESSTAISEASQLGSFIAYVMVIDTDSGPNGQTKCNIHHKMFQLSNMGSKEYKILVKEPLDRETIDHFVVSIVCHDMGSPPLKTKKHNDTSPMLTAVPFQSDNNLNMTWIIIIVAAAVILSVAIVVSITLCVFKCINHFNNLPAPADNPKFLSRTEMRQILYQTNNPVAITRNADDIFARNLQSIKPKSPYYPESEQLTNEWKFSTTPRRLPPTPQIYNKQVSDGSSEQGDNNSIVTSNNLNDTLPSQKDRNRGWSEGDISQQTSIISDEVLLYIMVLVISGRVAIAASSVISCGSTGVSPRATITAAAVAIVVIIAMIAGSVTGPVAAAIGVVRDGRGIISVESKEDRGELFPKGVKDIQSDEVTYVSTEYSNYRPNIPPTPKSDHEQDTYLEPVYKK
uniref:Cadherin domain-containing protein n=1 Tax=Octopus bimaculoides TaxID=37653 RepID=A0A0L8I168_OCTBM